MIENVLTLLTNKSSREINEIIYKKKTIRAKNKNFLISGGEAIKYLLKNINLEKTCVKNSIIIFVYLWILLLMSKI